MTAKHTPGPWTTGRAINAVDMGKFSFICPFGANSADQVAEIKANARLIAAAPDLLQALENLTDAVQSGTSYADDTAAGKALSILSGRSGTTWLSDARAAIAKAKGE